MKLSHAFGQLSRLLFTTVDEDEDATAFAPLGSHADPAPSPDPHLDWVSRVNNSVVARSRPQENEADGGSVGSGLASSEPETAAEPASGAAADEFAGEEPWWRVEPASPELAEEPVPELAAAAVSDADDAWRRAGATSPEPEEVNVAESLVEAHVPVEPLSDEPSASLDTSTLEAEEREAYADQSDDEAAPLPETRSPSQELELQAAQPEPGPSEQSLAPVDNDFGHLEIAT